MDVKDSLAFKKVANNFLRELQRQMLAEGSHFGRGIGERNFTLQTAIAPANIKIMMDSQYLSARSLPNGAVSVDCNKTSARTFNF